MTLQQVQFSLCFTFIQREENIGLGISWFTAFVIKCLISILVKDINKYIVRLKF